MALSDENGNLVEKYSYDACWVTTVNLQASAVNYAVGTNPVSEAKREGNRRDPNNWSQVDSRTDLILDRGYTGHEHIDGARIINMNGRMYDPLVGRMLSPDPVLQDPYNTQNYNRYSYVMNNPLKYTDPTEYRMAYHDLYYMERGGGGSGGGASLDSGGDINYWWEGIVIGSTMEYDPETGTYTTTTHYMGGGTSYENLSPEEVSNKNLSSYGNLNITENNYEKYSVKHSYVEVEGVSVYKGSVVLLAMKNQIYTDGTEAANSGDGKYFEDARVYTLNFGHFKNGTAMTIPGIGIFVGPGGAKDIDLLRHEYGHILQYNKWGAKIFWTEIVPGSLKSADKANNNWSFDHMNTWCEWSANYLSYQYFNEPSNWNMRDYQIYPNTVRPGVMPPFVTGPFDFKFNWLDN